MDSKKIQVRKTKNRGQGVFAQEHIKKGELIAEFDGEIYDWEDDRWTDELADHCIQFEEKKWRDSNGIARIINHSCEPNCGIKHLFQVVAMRDIFPDEEITWDYEMTENHPYWRMKCKCGTPSCRKIIGNYEHNMPPEIRKKYKGYISEWLAGKKFKKNE
ncbi:MAG: SET domain-containing protein-lysine N-methyltransferase [bacterium]